MILYFILKPYKQIIYLQHLRHLLFSDVTDRLFAKKNNTPWQYAAVGALSKKYGGADLNNYK